MPSSDFLSLSLNLIAKAVALAARHSGFIRARNLDAIATMSIDEKDKEISLLSDELFKSKEQIAILKSQLRERTHKPHYSLEQRLRITFFMECYKIPKNKVKKYFGVARSTFYTWLRKIDDASKILGPPHNKTPDGIAALVWEIAQINRDWGRFKISNQLKTLRVFLAASTVRNILNRAKPRKPSSENKSSKSTKPRQIPAFYPNHVWSIDHTIVFNWRIWPTYVLFAIDHYSRKVVAVIPVEGPNAAWTIDALEDAFRKLGPPKHVITDQHGVFISKAFDELMKNWNIKQRFGAIGKHGSICVTERVIKTFKYEYLSRVPLIRGFSHLSKLCESFDEWYNEWRPHMTLDGSRPNDYYCRDIPEPVARDAKTVPLNIEKRLFKETRITGYRLKNAA